MRLEAKWAHPGVLGSFDLNPDWLTIAYLLLERNWVALLDLDPEP